MKEIIVYLVSDALGETAQKVLTATVAQFPSVHVKEIKRFPFVESLDNLLEILEEALDEEAILLTTLVDKEFVQTVEDFCQKTGLAYVDYMSPLSRIIEKKTAVSPTETPGILHQLNKDYFSRVEAIEFSVRYDDGRDPRAFKDADFVLIGISRTSKTPLSMYLANKNYKVANLPLIPEVPIPRELFEIPAEKIVGLTTNIESLLQIRRARLKAFGMKEETSYTNVARIKEELLFADEVFKQLGIVPINVHNRAIEETAMLIEMERGSK